MAFDLDQAVIVCLALVALGYLIFVNRPVQRYEGRFTVEAPVETVWDLLGFKDGRISWGGNVEGTHKVDEASDEDVLEFSSGYVIRSRVTHHEPLRRMDSTYYYDPHGPLWNSDVVHSRLTLTPVPGGTEVQASFVVERRKLLKGLLGRLLHPFKIASLSHVLRYEAAQRRTAGALVDASGSVAPTPARTWFERVAPTRTQAMLAVAAFAWLTLVIGLQTALVFWVTILIHEYGHVWAMRRHGMQAARFYFVPLFGGVAIGGKMRTEAQSVEVTLMGPVFGLFPGIVLALVAVAGREGWFGATPETTVWASIVAMLSIFLNGTNLLPVVPLDGGHVVQAIVRPFAGRTWIFASGLVLLGVFIASAASMTVGLLVAFVILALLWTLSAQVKQELPPLSGLGALVTCACYVALILAHVAVIGAMFVTPNGPISAWTFLTSFVWAWQFALFGP